MWDKISSSGNLDVDFIRTNASKLNWTLLCRHQKLSNDIITEFMAYLDFITIGLYQELDEEFILKHKNKMIMRHLILNPKTKMSESFIRKYFSSRRMLTDVLRYRDMSNEFIIEFSQHIIAWDMLYRYSKCSDQLKRIISKEKTFIENIKYDTILEGYVKYKRIFTSNKFDDDIRVLPNDYKTLELLAIIKC